MNKYVIQNKKDLVFLSKKIINRIKRKALSNKKKRARICLHKDLSDKTNEMIIALNKKSFVPPHIHPDSKSESYHIIEGRMNIYIFRPNGKLFKVIQMGEKNSKKYFFYRMCKGFYHMPLSQSEWCVYHETYSGPFKKSKDVKFPKWAPNEEDRKGVLNFLREHNIKFTK